jgi:hypothetical protein
VQGGNCVGISAPVGQATFHADGGTTIEAHRAGIRVQAVVRDLPVYLRSLQKFGNGFRSGAGTPLLVRRAFLDGGVELVPAPRSDVRPLAGWKPAIGACDSLRLAGEVSTPASTTPLRQEARLLDRPGGRATFVLPEGTHLKSVQASGQGTEVDVVLEDGARISGWLDERLPKASFLTGGLRDFAICCGAGQPRPRDCANELRLFATDGIHLGDVGAMEAGTFFDVVASDGDWVTVSPREQFFGLWKGWRLEVRGEELEKCSALPLSVGAHSSGTGPALSVEPRSE